jgi:hypothetical protein
LCWNLENFPGVTVSIQGSLPLMLLVKFSGVRVRCTGEESTRAVARARLAFEMVDNDHLEDEGDWRSPLPCRSGVPEVVLDVMRGLVTMCGRRVAFKEE